MIDDKRYHPPQEPYLDVIYHDNAILVLDKPSGLLSVAGKTPDLEDCLESRAKALFPKARIVHRLDMATSGIIVMAKTREAHRRLSMAFEKRDTDKRYLAKVSGVMMEDQGEINMPLICDWPNRPLQMVDHENGKPSLTRWEVIKRDANTTLVALYPETGRTHQLRVHLKEIGHPILGDDFYAPIGVYLEADRLLLHAETLGFTHPETNERLKFSSVCPFE
jgi:tRNA pseudouridine32 synthase/23S rRNA pseudouridine746 synthase